MARKKATGKIEEIPIDKAHHLAEKGDERLIEYRVDHEVERDKRVGKLMKSVLSQEKQSRRLKNEIKNLKQQLSTLRTESESATEPPPVAEKAPKKEASTVPQVKKTGGRRAWALWPGLGLLAIAVILFFIYIMSPGNQMMAYLFVIVGAAGAGLTWYGLQKREEGVYFKEERPGEKPLKGRANCLNIYYRKDKRGNIKPDRIAFEILPQEELEVMQKDKRLGKYQRWRNDGNYYFVHEQNPEDGKLYPFDLPDQVYFSPRELVNVITMPASHRYAKPRATVMDKIKPVLLVVGIAIMALLMMVLSNPAPPQ